MRQRANDEFLGFCREPSVIVPGKPSTPRYAMTYPATKSHLTTILGRRERYAAEFRHLNEPVKR